MEILMLRHGEALASPGVPDAERPLTDEGRRQVTSSARALVYLASQPSIVLTSPLLRAVETVELAAAEFHPVPRVETTDALSPSGDAATVLMRVKTLEEDKVLLVGHEPFLGEFLYLLLAGSSSGAVPLRKAAVASVTLEPPVTGKGTLNWLLPPEVLSAVAQLRHQRERT